ncbi:ATP-dependent sacrificial sulfur transferase LarE [Lacunimicrobium album]
MPDALFEISRLHNLIRQYGQAAIAYSGGVDSALVAKLAVDAARLSPPLPEPIAVMAVSPSLATGELEAARKLAGEIGIELVTIETQETSLPGYRQNGIDRCYYCKSTLYSTIERLRSARTFDVVLNGTNRDDLGDHRPGLVAAREFEVRSPLADAGLRKQDVRELARYFGLSVWDKPATPCLSSRIVYGLEVTPQRLSRVDEAEAFLKKRTGLTVLRVRHRQNDEASLEVPLDAVERVQSPALWEEIETGLKSLGFRTVTLDAKGFRSGSLNEGIAVKIMN